MLYYPRQTIQSFNIERVLITTPSPTIYQDDCLHPCVRFFQDGVFGYKYWMVQSPLPARNHSYENPVIYHSNDLKHLGKEGKLLLSTPSGGGYNSDPCLFLERDKECQRLWVIYREVETIYAESLGYKMLIRGIYTEDGVSWHMPIDFFGNDNLESDMTQCPIIIRHNDDFCCYCVWYQYEPVRSNKGIAIWKSGSLISPAFSLTDKIIFKALNVCDKKAEIRVGGKIFYLPWPHRFDLWHCDYWEEDGALHMIACEEWGDNIVHAVSQDYIHFEMDRKPLVNNHYMQNMIHYRQYYYKPTVVIDDNGRHYFWTANNADYSRNMLFHAQVNQVRVVDK